MYQASVRNMKCLQTALRKKKLKKKKDKILKGKVLIILYHHSLVPCVMSALCAAKPGTLGCTINFPYKLSEVLSDEANCMKSQKQFGSRI